MVFCTKNHRPVWPPDRLIFIPFQFPTGVSLQKKRPAISITAYMDKNYDISKIGADKIALLGLFVVALLVARIIVFSRSAILLSEPIKLTRIGLSVSMPEGNGWKSEKKWRYYENAFYLSSIFVPGSGNPTAEASCRYVLVPETADPQALFMQKAIDAKGKIAKVEQIKKGTITFDWAQIKNSRTSLILIFGTARLPHNHRLDIEVKQIMNDPEMAEQAFKQIIENLNFEENQSIETGTQITAQVKSKSPSMRRRMTHINGFSNNRNAAI
jgi:hypothetical protein